MTAAPQAPAAAPSGAGVAAGVQTGRFDGNAYRKAVLAPMLAAGVVTIEDPFKVLALDPAVDDVAVLRERLVEVVGFWQRERNSPRYKQIASELVKRRPELETVLFSDERRALARMRVQGTRRAQESARIARIDRLLKAIVARHGGVPRSRLRLLNQLAKREGIDTAVLDSRLAEVTVLDDGYGGPPLPDTLRLQIRASLDELSLRGDRTRAVSLWAFLGMTATATADEVTDRHASLVADNQAQAHDRSKTVVAELLAQVKAVLMDGQHRAAYLVVLVAELRERLIDRVLEVAMVDGELWPADVELLVREAMALGTGLSQEQVRSAVRETATGLSIAVTTGKAPDYTICPSCQRQDTGRGALPAEYTPPASYQPPGGQSASYQPPTKAATAATAAYSYAVPAPSPPSSYAGPTGSSMPPAGVPAPGSGLSAAEEWRQLEREISQRKLVHALARAQRLQRSSPEITGPGGHLPQQRLAELIRQVADAREALGRALAEPTDAQREQGVYAVLERISDLDEATAALAAIPLAAPGNLRRLTEGNTVRLSWAAPATGRTLTYAVTRVSKDAQGTRHEHGLGLTTRCEAVDADLPRDAVVWHEVVAQLGTRRSAPVATEPAPVIADVSGLRASRGPDGVTLSWTLAEPGEVVVERARTDVPDAPLRRSRARGTRWKDADVDTGATYRYVVRIESAVGGVIARTPGCTVDVTVDALTASVPTPVQPVMRFRSSESRTTPAAAGPARTEVPARTDGPVQLGITGVPPGIVVSWETSVPGEVTILASQAPLGAPGDPIDLGALGDRARTLGFAVGSGTAFDADPGIAAIITPVLSVDGVATVCASLRHVALGAITGLRAEREGARKMLRFDYPRGCGEALVVWRRDRPPLDAADAEGGEVLTAETYAARGGWAVPADGHPAFLHVLVLPVAHLGEEPVFGPGASLRVG